MKKLRVLAACEYSGRVRDAFASLGHDAWSCDLLPSETLGQHYQGDVRELLAQPWDIIIGFPPCTYLCSSGMHWTTRGLRDPKLTEDALKFVRCILGANCKHIALENPVGAISTRIRKPDQIVQPHWFGDNASKTTCLWTKNLPPLVPTNPLPLPTSGRWQNQTPSGQNKLGPSADRWKLRSSTYPGLAKAMAAQWSAFVLSSPPTASPAPIAENLFAWSASNTTPIVNVQVQETPKNSDTTLSKKTASSTEFVDVTPDAATLMFLLTKTR